MNNYSSDIMKFQEILLKKLIKVIALKLSYSKLFLELKGFQKINNFSINEFIKLDRMCVN